MKVSLYYLLLFIFLTGFRIENHYSSNIEKLRFGMTEQEVKFILEIPPRLRDVSDNKREVRLYYNIDSKHPGIINNNSISKYEYYGTESVHFGFLDNSLSFISYDYRDIRCEDYYNNLVKNGFTFKQRELGYWDGTGILLKDRVFVDLADMFESGYVWCTYYYDVPKVIKYFKIKK